MFKNRGNVEESTLPLCTFALMIPAKILLFGEYLTIQGAQTLVIPFSHFGGKWQDNSAALKQQMQLKDFAEYLANGIEGVHFDTRQMQKDLENGLYFDSNIPTGYGLGSSGAVTAAVFERYGTLAEEGNGKDLAYLKDIFSEMESFFHGKSSGIDPLICHVKRPVWLKSKQDLQVVNISSLQDASLFLLDTEIARSTSPFVQIFMEKCKNLPYVNALNGQLSKANNQAIKHYIEGNGKALFQDFAEIGEQQFSLFSEMILPQFKALHQNALAANSDFKLKLCGAGGGGFILGITPDFKKTKRELSRYKLIKIEAA